MRGKIIVPVLPSDIDIHACSRCIRDLLLVAKVRREDNRIGVVANRIRRNTLIYQSLHPLPGDAGNSHRGDAARLAELPARRGARRRRARDEELYRPARTSRSGGR